MDIKLSPVAGLSSALVAFKQGDVLAINGLTFDFSKLPEGGTLPAEAIASPWFPAPVERADGHLLVTLTFPERAEADEAERFPAILTQVADGRIALPGPEVNAQFPVLGFAPIHWAALVTAEMKQARESEARFEACNEKLRHLRVEADQAIAPLQDAVDLDEATDEDVERLKFWKRYRIKLTKVPAQPGFPETIDWPALPS